MKKEILVIGTCGIGLSALAKLELELALAKLTEDGHSITVVEPENLEGMHEHRSKSKIDLLKDMLPCPKIHELPPEINNRRERRKKKRKKRK